jgi:hypothetical protein
VSDARSVQSSSSVSCNAANMSWDSRAVMDLTRESDVLSRNVTYVSGKLGYEIKVIELPQ